jgi:GntR family transcriptional repressor for pyruvate dehydrogenase complex
MESDQRSEIVHLQTSENVPFRAPRVGDVVAGVLRRRILSGQLPDGTTLPKQSELLKEFRVSRPSLREALRILESENLITVRRGNVGGSVVRAPKTQGAAYALGLVLKSRNVSLRDVGLALQQLEPICAALCASRPDRNKTVVPALRQTQKDAQKAGDDRLAITRSARRFHEILVDMCGNETIIATVGAIESLWSGQEQAWAAEADRRGEFPGELAAASFSDHDELIELIRKGDADGTASVARRHLGSTYFFDVADDSREIDMPSNTNPVQYG